ncbi:unnamed protein product, partial [Nesidiocoris tenuis]
MEGDTRKFEHYFQDYHLEWVPALRVADRGRPCGGVLLAVRKNVPELVSFNFAKVHEVTCLELTLRINGYNQELAFVPTYFREATWESQLESTRAALTELEDKVIIWLGDFNARVADRQVLSEEMVEMTAVTSVRNSKDRILNHKGELVLETCEEFGLVILNGRTSGDEGGEFTFISHLGSSVNDFVCVSAPMIEWELDLEVGKQIFSDHLPLQFKFVVRSDTSNLLERRKRQKFTWNKKIGDGYGARLMEALHESRLSTTTEEASVTDLLGCVETAAGPPQKGSSFESGRKPWFDWECYRRRKEAFGLLNLARQNNSIFAQKQYAAARTEYKRLIRQKKQEFYEKTADELNRSVALSSRDFWKRVRMFRKSNNSDCVGVTMDQLQEHFCGLLNLASGVQLDPVELPLVEIPDLDAEFSRDELKAVLRGVRSGKAPGVDGIPYEFFKEAPDLFLDLLLKAYNDIYKKGILPDDLNRSLICPLKKKMNGCGIDN